MPKYVSKQSSLFDAAAASNRPKSLADQQADATAPAGVHESTYRANKQARKAAMRGTNSNPRIDSEPKNTTGPLPNFTTVRQNDVRQV